MKEISELTITAIDQACNALEFDNGTKLYLLEGQLRNFAVGDKVEGVLVRKMTWLDVFGVAIPQWFKNIFRGIKQ